MVPLSPPSQRCQLQSQPIQLKAAVALETLQVGAGSGRRPAATAVLSAQPRTRRTTATAAAAGKPDPQRRSCSVKQRRSTPQENNISPFSTTCCCTTAEPVSWAAGTSIKVPSQIFGNADRRCSLANSFRPLRGERMDATGPSSHR